MKALQENFISAFLVIVFGMVLLTNTTHAADEPLPPEVKVLIGVKIPPKAPGRRGEFPGWFHLWGAEIEGEKGFGVLQREGVVILVIESVIKQSTTILDARVIPGKLLRFYLENGELKWRKNEKQWYRITKDCSREGSNKKETILGMWKFEPNSKCTDPSSLVKKAWLLDLENGRLTDIPTQGVSCREPDCGDDE